LWSQQTKLSQLGTIEMVKTVGVREFKTNPSKYLRLVKEENQEFDITVRGQTMARLVPVEQHPNPNELAEYWRQHRQLAHEISKHWPADVSAVEAVREQRREL